MSYLFATYTIVFLLIAGYVFLISKRQKDAVKELMILQNLEERDEQV